MIGVTYKVVIHPSGTRNSKVGPIYQRYGVQHPQERKHPPIDAAAIDRDEREWNLSIRTYWYARSNSTHIILLSCIAKSGV